MTINSKDPATTISIVADAPMAEATAMPVTTNYTTTPKPVASTTQTSHPPPGVKDGGRWGTTSGIVGPVTWTYCLVTAFCFGVFSGCGLCALLCPCDKGDVYLIDNMVYDAKGSYLGPASKFPIAPIPGRQ
jgi:hypothetical protein